MSTLISDDYNIIIEDKFVSKYSNYLRGVLFQAGNLNSLDLCSVVFLIKSD